MTTTYLPEWLVESLPPEKTGGLRHWSQELGVSPQELRSALNSTSMNTVDTPAVSERRRQADRRREDRGRRD